MHAIRTVTDDSYVECKMIVPSTASHIVPDLMPIHLMRSWMIVAGDDDDRTLFALLQSIYQRYRLHVLLRRVIEYYRVSAQDLYLMMFNPSKMWLAYVLYNAFAEDDPLVFGLFFDTSVRHFVYHSMFPMIHTYAPLPFIFDVDTIDSIEKSILNNVQFANSFARWFGMNQQFDKMNAHDRTLLAGSIRTHLISIDAGHDLRSRLWLIHAFAFIRYTLPAALIGPRNHVTSSFASITCDGYRRFYDAMNAVRSSLFISTNH